MTLQIKSIKTHKRIRGWRKCHWLSSVAMARERRQGTHNWQVIWKSAKRLTGRYISHARTTHARTHTHKDITHPHAHAHAHTHSCWAKSEMSSVSYKERWEPVAWLTLSNTSTGTPADPPGLSTHTWTQRTLHTRGESSEFTDNTHPLGTWFPTCGAGPKCFVVSYQGEYRFVIFC